MLTKEQKKLINNLHKNLVDINEEAMNDEEFYEWLNENYFFDDNLEDVIIKLKEVKENLE